jgi:beta-mannanase
VEQVHRRLGSGGEGRWSPDHAALRARDERELVRLDAPWNAIENYYPGDAYVDWTCADGYNWGTSQTIANAGWVSHWQTFDELFATTYQRITAIAPTKPFMIGEFASSEMGGSKAQWISDAASRMHAAYPLLRGFIWFNYNKETDWRVKSSAGSLSAFKSAFVNDSYFAWP